MAASSSTAGAGAAPRHVPTRADATAQDSSTRAAPVAAPWAAPPGPWTEPDLHHFPTDSQCYEIVDGCLHATPRPGGNHQHLTDTIVEVLSGTAPPSWRPASRIGVRLGGSYLVPDAVVLRPGAPDEATWADAADLALVVEVESAHSRRVDRCLKPALYAEAGIESYWRVECTSAGAVAHLYTRAAAGHYHLHRSVQSGQCVTTELPYAVQVAPATWH